MRIVDKPKSHAERVRNYERNEVRLKWFERGFLVSGLFASCGIVASVLYTYPMPHAERMALLFLLGLGCAISIPIIIGAFVIAGEASLRWEESDV